MNSIPICFYPMKKIVIDDDPAFSQSLLLQLHGNNCIEYNSPKDALNYLLQEYEPTLTKATLININELDTDFSTQPRISINIEKLRDFFLNSPHQDISVLLIDYHMPEIKGIDFLKQIRHLPIRKALITGESDCTVAVDAFNSGLIDAYVRKDDPDFSKKIQNIVFELEWKYFIELSSIISEVADFNFLKDEHFILVFKQFINENKIKSFCLTHPQGNFITQSKAKEQKHFLIRKKIQLDELSKMAEEDGGSQETIQNLRLAKMIPFFDSKNHWEIPASQWDKFLHPANDLSMDSTFVWTTISR